jgi:gliding motility-associated-like protein
VAVDASGNVYVGDYSNNQVKMIPAGSNTPVVIGSGFSDPDGIAVDGAGNVYVADVGNNAVKQIKPTGGYYIGPFLPAGLSFANATGVLSGTPTAASPATNYTVTAYNSIGEGTATVNITVLSNNASLSNLVLSSGPLTPVFATGTTSYSATVASNVTSVTVTPTTSVPTATVTVNGAVVTPGTASQGLPLVQGANTITTVVKAQNGTTTETYTLTVTQTAPGAAFRPVNYASLADSASSVNDGILVHQGVSPNGDGINDFLVIEGITQYPDNHLMIINRNGALVYQAKGYDNANGVFDGHSNVNGRMQEQGTYFYALDYSVNGVLRHRTGYIVLKY